MKVLLHDPIKRQAASAIEEGIIELLQKSDLDAQQAPGEEHIYQQLADAPKIEMGHMAYGCFPLAKALKKSPAQIAKDLVEVLKLDSFDLIQSFKAVGPYVNLFFDHQELAEKTISSINSGEMFERKLIQETPKTMVEFSQPNTHKELHVGHMRNLCLGDALIRMHRYAGFDILAVTFPGDVGTHVAKCLWFLKNINNDPIPEERKGAWLGEMYSKANNLLEEQKGTEKEEENRKELTKILKQIEAKEGEYYELWKETRQWSIELMKGVYQWANVDFDRWYWESEVDEASIDLVKEYQKKGLFVEDKGAVGIQLGDELGFAMLLKSDGTGLYATKDVELARRKFKEGIEKSVYIVDKRQALHFKQVFAVLEKMGFENAKNCYHLQYDFVELPDGAMSSRKGNIVALQELISQMVSTIENKHLEKYRDSWKQKDIDTTANMIAQGAIKYGMNAVDPNKKIVFEMNEWLKLDGNSGPYLQYVYARIQSIMEKMKAQNPDMDQALHSEKPNFNELQMQKEELALILKLGQFNNVVEMATLNFKSSQLCSYLYELAKLFNSFYAECPVMKATNETQKKFRAGICHGVAEVMANGLRLLGIPAPAKM